LLERRLVLLVDDDHAELVHRRKQRRTCADDDPRLAALHALPHAQSLRVGHARMQHRDVLEARAEPTDGLRRECDLGHEHDRAAAELQRTFDQREVHLGLAAARDAVQQERTAGATFERLEQALQRRHLALVQPFGPRTRRARGLELVRVGLDLLEPDPAALVQRARRRIRQVELAAQVAQLDAAADVDQRAQHAVLLGLRFLELRELGGTDARRDRRNDDLGRLALALERRRQHGVQRLAPRARVAPPDPAREREQLRARPSARRRAAPRSRARARARTRAPAP
jgi:hypothetical protein